MKKADVGILVGRFQVPQLTQGHIDLIQQVVENHSKTIIFLGLSPLKCSLRNPLDFETRKQLILDKFPSVNVLYIKDVGSDTTWSNTLDAMIRDTTGPQQKVMLYGSRDSFIKHYSGNYPTKNIEQTVFVSGTDARRKVSNQVKASSDFREGVVWATSNQYPKCQPTVDIAIIKGKTILLAKRNCEDGYRFPGGYVNPGETFEHAAIREGKEETCLELADPTFIGSFVVFVFAIFRVFRGPSLLHFYAR
jgi:bifunctional NMN adenylyltransferase/nudix hydrolase